jgi:hypothetical protein
MCANSLTLRNDEVCATTTIIDVPVMWIKRKKMCYVRASVCTTEVHKMGYSRHFDIEMDPSIVVDM